MSSRIKKGTTEVIVREIDRYTGEPVHYRKVTAIMGNAISDARCDGVLIRKHKDGSYWERAFNGPVNVRWFGATGDGTTDDTAAIQAAFNATRKKDLFFPRGVYRITQSVTIPLASHIGGKVYGEGSIGQGGTVGVAATQILVDGAIEGFVFGNADQALFAGIEIRNLQFKGTATAVAGLVLNRISNFFVERCTFSDFPVGTGLRIDGITAKVQYGVIIACHFGVNLIACRIHQGNGMRVLACYFDGADNNPGPAGENVLAGSKGIFFDEGDTNEMSGNVVQFYSKAVHVKGIQRFTSNNTRVEGCPEHGFFLVNSPDFRLLAGSMTNFIIGGNKGVGIEWDAVSTNGAIYSIPITSFTSEIQSGEANASTIRIYGPNIQGGEIRARDRFYTAGYVQTPEVRAATANPTQDTRLLFGVNGATFQQNKDGAARILDILAQHPTATPDYLALRRSDGQHIGRIDSKGRYAIGLSSAPSARVHIAGAPNPDPGSAGLKMESGPLLTAPEDGALEFDGTSLYFTSGGERKELGAGGGGLIGYDYDIVVGTGSDPGQGLIHMFFYEDVLTVKIARLDKNGNSTQGIAAIRSARLFKDLSNNAYVSVRSPNNPLVNPTFSHLACEDFSATFALNTAGTYTDYKLLI